MWTKKQQLGLLIIMLVAACSKQPAAEPEKKTSKETLISTTVAKTSNLESREESVGTLEGLIDPTIAAEVSGRVLKVLAHPGQAVKKGELLALIDDTDYVLERKEVQAEVARIEALLGNQGRLVDRNKKLRQKNFISQNALDDVSTQQSALSRQLEGAKAKLESTEHTGSKTRIYAPVDGVIEKQVVATGEYVKPGDPILQIISKQRLRAHLPFPETMASKLHPGLKVRLTTPTTSTEVIAVIREMKPLISANSRAIDVIAEVVNQDGWQPGASVNGSVVLSERDAAVIVPEQSVVLRPKGEVIYVIKDNQAEQRLVKTGLRQSGQIEVIEGLSAGEVVATDGAAFLTDKAKVKTAEVEASKSGQAK